MKILLQMKMYYVREYTPTGRFYITYSVPRLNGLTLNNWIQSVRLFKCLTRKNVFVAWSHAISHLGSRLLHDSLMLIKLQPRFTVCNISYLCVFFSRSSHTAETQYRAHTQKQCVMCNINLLPFNFKVSL